MTTAKPPLEHREIVAELHEACQRWKTDPPNDWLYAQARHYPGGRYYLPYWADRRAAAYSRGVRS